MSAYFFLLPELFVLLAGVLVFGTLFVREQWFSVMRWGSVVILGIGFGSLVFTSFPVGGVLLFSDMLVVDHLSQVGRALLLLSGMVVLMAELVKPSFPREGFFLVVMAVLGGCVAVGATNMLLLYVGLELLAFPGFLLVAFGIKRGAALAAAVKYLVLSVLSTGSMLYGIALLYGMCGTIQFSTLSQCSSTFSGDRVLFALPVLLIALGLGFKMGIVPAQAWMPEAYTASPVSVTTFLATVAKVAGVVTFFRALGILLVPMYLPTMVILAILGIASILFGTTAALMQQNIRTMLAYASMAHMGFVTCLMMLGNAGAEQVSWYLASYLVATIGIFAYLVWTGLAIDQDKPPEHQLVSSLFPLEAGSIVVLLLSMAGLPPLWGFWVKVIGAMEIITTFPKWWGWGLGAFLLLSSVVGFFYYLSLVRYLLPRRSQDSHDEDTETQQKVKEPDILTIATTLSSSTTIPLRLIIILCAVIVLVGSITPQLAFQIVTGG